MVSLARDGEVGRESRVQSTLHSALWTGGRLRFRSQAGPVKVAVRSRGTAATAAF